MGGTEANQMRQLLDRLVSQLRQLFDECVPRIAIFPGDPKASIHSYTFDQVTCLHYDQFLSWLISDWFYILLNTGPDAPTRQCSWWTVRFGERSARRKTCDSGCKRNEDGWRWKRWRKNRDLIRCCKNISSSHEEMWRRRRRRRRKGRKKGGVQAEVERWILPWRGWRGQLRGFQCRLQCPKASPTEEQLIIIRTQNHNLKELCNRCFFPHIRIHSVFILYRAWRPCNMMSTWTSTLLMKNNLITWKFLFSIKILTTHTCYHKDCAVRWLCGLFSVEHTAYKWAEPSTWSLQSSRCNLMVDVIMSSRRKALIIHLHDKRAQRQLF